MAIPVIAPAAAVGAASGVAATVATTVASSVVRRVGQGLAAGAGAVVASQVVLRTGIWRAPRPMPHQVAKWLDHPLRLRYRNPGELLGLFGLYGGMTVADLGCGTGLFTVEMARMVGQSGRVHAVDIQAPMLAATQQRVDAEGMHDRVHYHHAGIHDMPLEDGSVDLAVMVAVAAELPARVMAFEEVRRILKPGGRLAISEELPDPAYAPAVVVRRWAEAAGFHLLGQTGSPFCYSMILSND